MIFSAVCDFLESLFVCCYVRMLSMKMNRCDTFEAHFPSTDILNIYITTQYKHCVAFKQQERHMKFVSSFGRFRKIQRL